MSYRQDYLDDILVRMAYHSSGIEGNTISLPETVSIILEGTLPSQGKSIREFYEIENHRQAFTRLLTAVTNQEALSMDLVKDIHQELMDRLQHDRGQFKTMQNAIIGAEFRTASPQEVPFLIQQWVDNVVYRLDLAKVEDDILSIIAESHIEFERIHPFSDGNGRTGRLIMLYLSIKYLGAPVIISKDDRAIYMEKLANQDAKGLTVLLKKSLDFERERQNNF